MTLYERYLWTRESTARTLVGLCVLASLFIAGYGITHAALSTSYDVTNEVQMNLDVSITRTQTTGIILSSPQVNGVNHRFATTTGGLLRIRSGSFREDITYTSATIGSDNKVTLVGVTRNICAQNSRAYISCGDGRNWGKGAIVELTVDARLINLKSNLDRSNIFTSSGAIAFSGSGSLAWPTFATTAARDQALGATPGGPVRTACVTATGLCYMYIGGAWTAFGNTGVSTATESAVGTVELGTVADQLAKTITGNAGPTVVQTQHLISSGSIHGINGTIYASRIPMLNASGALSASLGGLGRINFTSGALMIGAGSGAAMTLRPGALNTVIVSDGTRWSASTIPVTTVVVLNNATAGTATGTSVTSKSYFKEHTYTVTGSTLVNGVSYTFDGMYSYTYGAGNYQFEVSLGNTTLISCSITPTGSSDGTIEGRIWGTAAAGASVAVRARIKVSAQGGSKLCEGYSTAGVNIGTNADRKLQFSFTPSSSNASNAVTLSTLTVIRNTYP